MYASENDLFVTRTPDRFDLLARRCMIQTNGVKSIVPFAQELGDDEATAACNNAVATSALALTIIHSIRDYAFIRLPSESGTGKHSWFIIQQDLVFIDGAGQQYLLSQVLASDEVETKFGLAAMLLKNSEAQLEHLRKQVPRVLITGLKRRYISRGKWFKEAFAGTAELIANSNLPQQ
jgi:hypothetical protein